MRPSLKYHISPLHQPLINKLITTLRSFSRFTTPRQEYPTLLILNTHEIGRYLNIDDIRAITVRLKIIQEQIVRIIHKEVQCVNHFAIISHQGHFNRLFNDFSNGLPSFLFLLQKFNLHLFFGFTH